MFVAFSINFYNDMKERVLITSALPYANGYIHLGHCAGAYLTADIYARFLRSVEVPVLFVCGSDEHGAAITISAEKEGVTPQNIIDKYHFANYEAFRAFGMSFDVYSRTSLPHHHETAREFFLDFLDKGYFSEREEEQFYDEQAAMFLPDRYVEGICPNCGYDKARGDQCDKCGAYYNQIDLQNPRSLISGTTPSVRKTTHWYFQLGQFQQFLEQYIESHSHDWKDNVLQQARSWLKAGLGERAITRDLDWGVKVPLDRAAGKVLYVWFDAVLGYISATKEWAEKTGNSEAWKSWWQSPNTEYVAFIGKDNIVFHTLMFPAMLHARGDGFLLPDNVPANEFLNLEGEKFSKSRNWAIDLRDYLRDFPEPQHVDALRYALLVNLPETRDSDFTWRDYQARVNNELAAILGNFVNRAAAFLTKNYNASVPILSDEFSKLPEAWALLVEDCQNLRSLAVEQGIEPNEDDIVEKLSVKYLRYFSEHDVRLVLAFVTAHTLIAKNYREFRFRDACLATMNAARAANKYFNDTAPWKALKEVPEIASKSLYLCVQAMHSLAVFFAPILPNTAQAIGRILGKESDTFLWNSALELAIAQGTPLGEVSILFRKIEDEQVQAQIAKLGHGATVSTEAKVPSKAASKPVQEAKTRPEKNQDNEKSPIEGIITIDDFKRVQLRTALVRAAERVPKSEKLLKLRVDIGTEERQILAGIGKFYTPEELLGKTVVVVANLAPAKLMGHESQGMLLAANTPDGKVALVSPIAETGAGAEVR